MLYWLLTVVVLCVVWAAMWKSQPKMAFGALIGVAVGWLFSRFMDSYLQNMEELPVWLPPLPFAIIATLLIVVGVIIWFRADADDRASGDRSDRAER